MTPSSGSVVEWSPQRRARDTELAARPRSFTQACNPIEGVVPRMFSDGCRILTGALLAALAIGIPASAGHGADSGLNMQTRYPTKPIRLIVAQTAGGNSGFVARAYAQRLSERFGQQIIKDAGPYERAMRSH